MQKHTTNLTAKLTTIPTGRTVALQRFKRNLPTLALAVMSVYVKHGFKNSLEMCNL